MSDPTLSTEDSLILSTLMETAKNRKRDTPPFYVKSYPRLRRPSSYMEIEDFFFFSQIFYSLLIYLAFRVLFSFFVFWREESNYR